MVLPVIAVSILATMGLLLPADSGEKMGLQVTLLLTLVFFIQLLQDEVPFWQLYNNTPKILMYFVLVMGAISYTIIQSAWTLYLHHMNDDELENFGQGSKNTNCLILIRKKLKLNKYFTDCIHFSKFLSPDFVPSEPK